MGSFGSRRPLTSARLVVVAAMCGIGMTVALAAPAMADPPGSNGTVKINNVPVDNVSANGIANEPHVGCQFAVRFFGFDMAQRADITFTAQAPTGTGQTLLAQKDLTISTTPAAGGPNDPDKVFNYADADLGLGAYTPQPRQGYHVKLSVRVYGNNQVTEKHKVFWVQPCAVNPSTSASTPGSPSGPSSPAVPGGNGGGGGLPITGPAAGVTAGVGVLLLGAGATLLVLRRRRRVTFTS